MDFLHFLTSLLLFINFGCLQAAAAVYFPRKGHLKGNDEGRRVPKSSSSVVGVFRRRTPVFHRPRGEEKKVYFDGPRIQEEKKKRRGGLRKYVKHTSGVKLGGGKKCCESGPLDEGQYLGPFKYGRPVFKKWYHHSNPGNRLYEGYRNIKPVTEHIPDDLKYDFRTKTHSYD